MNSEIQNFLNVFLQGLVDLLVPVLIAALILLAKRAWTLITTLLDDAQEKQLMQLAAFVVHAAEQSGITDAIENSGMAKKSYALSLLQSLLKQKGLDKVADNLPILEARIEAAVSKELNARQIKIKKTVQ